MADRFIVGKGLYANLPGVANGQLMYTTDEQLIYIDHNNEHTIVNAGTGLGVSFGTASGSAAAFTAEVSYIKVLREGTVIALYNGVGAANSANATLNINALGAYPIYYSGAKIVASKWPSKTVGLFVYNTKEESTGCWSMIYSYGANTTYTNASLGQGYGTCSTAVGTAAKTASLSSYTLTSGGIVAIKFTNGNTAANPTLNINSKGAKNIFYQGVNVGTDVIQAGDIVTMIYDGTQYHILAIDRSQTVADKTKAAISFTGTSATKTFDGSTAVAITYTDVNALKADTKYAGSSTQGGIATQAAKTTGTLTIGDQTFNGSANVTITAEDLGLSKAMSFRGTSSTAISDGATTSPINISGGSSLTPANGDVVLYENYEYVWTGSAWERLGGDGSYALSSITITGNNGLTGGGNLSASRTISHATKDVSKTDATSAPTTYISDITYDSYGHLATINTYDARAQFVQKIDVADDDVVIVNGTNLTASTSTTPKLSFSHVKAGTAGSNSGSAKAAITGETFTLGAGETGYVVIPQITVDAYGHTKYTGEEKIGFTIPNPKATFTVASSESAATAATYSKTYSPTGDNVTITFYKMKGATASTAGYQGFVPKPAAGDDLKFLRGDGTWQYSVEWVDF